MCCTLVYTIVCCTLAHCTPVCCTLVCCTPVWHTLVYCTPVWCTLVCCTPVYYTPVYCTLLCCTPVYYTPVYCTPVYCTPVYCTTVCYTPVYCTPVCCSPLPFVIPGGSLYSENNTTFVAPLKTLFMYTKIHHQHHVPCHYTWVVWITSCMIRVSDQVCVLFLCQLCYMPTPSTHLSLCPPLAHVHQMCQLSHSVQV